MKCFLSHSSKDKGRYVQLVADRLRPNMIVYDAYTFEAGMQTAEEILKGLDSTDLFVLFISDHSLNSDWVKREILGAKNRFDQGQIERIFPIIIDKSVTHKDSRIPDWMREAYNLRLISRPTSAVRRIEQRLRELSWNRHPKLREKEKIFVGRNELIKGFEERIDDMSKETPRAVVASGLKKIGRRAFLKNALIKTNVTDPSYDPVKIHLSQEDGIEGFIVKLYDLGIAGNRDVGNLMFRTLQEKISLAADICNEILHSDEIILVEDDGSIVPFDGIVAEWFLSILSNIQDGRILFAIASTYRVRQNLVRKNDKIFSIDVPELNIVERKGLLKRFSDFEDVSLTREDFEFVADLLKGYPDQVYFAVDAIKSEGIIHVKQNSDQIIEFNKNRASIALQKYQGDQKELELLRLLSGFEFISYKLMEEICGNDPNTGRIIERFVSESICEEIGATREYLRVSDVIRDYMMRNRLEIAPEFKEKIRIYTEKFVQEVDGDFDTDASEFFYFTKTALLEGFSIDARLLIPAHYLSAMRQLYSDRRYGEVVKLCDKVLLNSHYLDGRAEQDVRYYLCQSLARQRNERFLQEVQKIQGGEHDFLLGFYYRHQGRYREAENRLKSAMANNRAAQRARRELVTVYLLTEAWDEAIAIARDNYNKFPSNPYMVQAHFNCLIQQPKSESNRLELNELLAAFDRINSEKSREMKASAMALMVAVYGGSQEHALNIINDAIATYSDNDYPVLTKIEICCRFGNKEELKKCLDVLNRKFDKRSSQYNSYKKAEAIYYALCGNKAKAERIVETEMNNFSEAGKARLLERIYQILGH